MRTSGCALLFAVGLLPSGCRDDASPIAPAIPTTSVWIAGTWTGTVKSLEVVYPWDLGPLCTAVPVTVELTQERDSTTVTGAIHADCIIGGAHRQATA